MISSFADFTPIGLPWAPASPPTSRFPPSRILAGSLAARRRMDYLPRRYSPGEDYFLGQRPGAHENDLELPLSSMLRLR
jgi:hypothetical protein